MVLPPRTRRPASRLGRPAAPPDSGLRARSHRHGGHVVALPRAAAELLDVTQQAADDLARGERAAGLPQAAQAILAEELAARVGGLGDAVTVEQQGVAGA